MFSCVLGLLLTTRLGTYLFLKLGDFFRNSKIAMSDRTFISSKISVTETFQKFYTPKLVYLVSI